MVFFNWGGFINRNSGLVNLQDSSLVLTKFGKQCTMHYMPSGHVAVGVMDFHEEGWQLPELTAEHHRCEKAFRFFSAVTAQSTTLMWQKSVFSTSTSSGPLVFDWNRKNQNGSKCR